MLAACNEAFSTHPRKPSTLFAAQLGRLLRKRQPGAADLGSWPILYTLQRYGDLRPSDLAGKLQLDASTVSRHVRQLEDGGLVERTEDPDDGRAALVRVTGAGEEALERGRQRRRDQIARVLAHWPRADVDAFATFATRFSEDLDRMLDDAEGTR